MGSRHPILTHSLRTARSAEQRGGCPEADCPLCGRTCRVYWPTGGDGSVRITFWHKDPQTRRWCRAEVDVADVHWPPPAGDDGLEQDTESEWGPPGPYRGERVHVLAGKCSTCIFRPGNIMQLHPGRVKDMVEGCRQRQGVITCHSTLGTDEPAICRGFWDGYGPEIWLLRLAVTLDIVVYDPVPAEKAGR